MNEYAKELRDLIDKLKAIGYDPKVSEIRQAMEKLAIRMEREDDGWRSR